MREFVSFFTGIFNKHHVLAESDTILPKRVLKAEARQWLDRDFSEDEIFSAVKLINRDKAPGPDGYTAGFFQDNWELVKRDVLHAVKNVFHSARMLKVL